MTNWLPALDVRPDNLVDYGPSRGPGWLLAGIGAVVTGILTVVSFGAALAGGVACAGAVLAGVAIGVGSVTALAGLGMIGFGLNETVADITGYDYLKDGLGMSASLYDKITTLVGSILCTIFSYARPYVRTSCFPAAATKTSRISAPATTSSPTTNPPPQPPSNPY